MFPAMADSRRRHRTRGARRSSTLSDWQADRMADGGPGPGRERVVVALTGAPASERLIYRAADLAGRSGGELAGVHVRRSQGAIDEWGDERLGEHRRLLERL